MKKPQIAIIGGGPASFTAAISLFENATKPVQVDIFDKNIPLKTILHTGNGRCNLSNEIYDYKELASNYPRGEKFLYSAFSKFGVKETLEWFNRHGVETYVQEDKRIFPKTDKASTIRDMFLKEAKKHNINIYSHTCIDKIPSKYDKIIIATGGSSYKLAKYFGHTIKELKPSLTGFILKENYTKTLAGVSIQNAEVSSVFNGKMIKKFKGDFVFTHKGVSGPVIFKTSAYCCYLDYSQKNPLLLNINFVPEKDKQSLEKELINEFNSNPYKSLENLLKKYLAKSLINTLLEKLMLDSSKKASQITKEERKNILSMLTETQLTVISPEQDGEIVTAGGVCLDEINPKTMESKLKEGLYFCGEILDIDGLTGGFNLQSCWSTGYIAGTSLALSL